MTIEIQPEPVRRPTADSRRIRSLAAKFPQVPLHAWSVERRARLIWLTALLWSLSMLAGGLLGAGLLG